MSKEPRVKIVAVAKDEAAYFPEWVFHHFYLGFDAIDVYVNRTTDNSVPMLQAIQKVYPRLNIFNADWVDQLSDKKKKNIQAIIYQEAFEQCRKNGDFDYVLFIDIDEFWTPTDYSFSVKHLIKTLPSADVISFGWFNENGVSKEFCPLANQITGSLHFLVKSLVKVNKSVTSIRIHRPIVKHGSSVLSDGTEFKPSTLGDEILDEAFIYHRNVMVVHRMNRSPMEYVSLLNRGRPSAPNSLKLNRISYNVGKYPDSTMVIEKGFERYNKQKCTFLAIEAIAKELVIAQDFVKQRYTKVIDKIKTVLPEHYPDLVRVFSRCLSKDMDIVLHTILANPTINKPKYVDTLTRVALNVEKYDKDKALQFWKKAAILRPKGPQIIKKLKEYGVTVS